MERTAKLVTPEREHVSGQTARMGERRGPAQDYDTIKGSEGLWPPSYLPRCALNEIQVGIHGPKRQDYQQNATEETVETARNLCIDTEGNREGPNRERESTSGRERGGNVINKKKRRVTKSTVKWCASARRGHAADIEEDLVRNNDNNITST